MRSMGRISFWCLCTLGIGMLAAGVQTVLATSEECNYTVKVNGQGQMQAYPPGMGCPTLQCEDSPCVERQTVGVGYVWVWCECVDGVDGPLCITLAHVDFSTLNCDRVNCVPNDCPQPYICDLHPVAPPGPDGYAQCTCKCVP